MKQLSIALLLIVSGCLLWLCFDSVNAPISFKATRESRELVIVEHLSNIRAAEMAYNNTHGHYTADFDSLINFLKNDSADVVLKDGVLTDYLMEAGVTTDKKAMAIIKAGGKKDKELYDILMQMGFRRDTTKVPMLEFVYPTKVRTSVDENGVEVKSVDIDVDDMCNVPYSNPVVRFNVEVGIQNSGGIDIPVIWCGVHDTVFLADLDKQELVNEIARQEEMEKYPGVKFGDVTRVTNNVGSWE